MQQGKMNKGLTLIEVLVSVAILSGGLIVVYQPLLRSLSALNYVEVRAEATREASNLLWKLQEDANRSGVFPYRGKTGVIMGKDRAFNYRLHARSVGFGDSLQEVELIISWKSGSQDKQLKRVSYISNPNTWVAA
jgi:prepilin-type N-terminal cleavage/methylation domain-containing protein